jgi:murein DD-endopeptidase MepM/ murein hydrolase activator NlpD
VAPLPGAPVSSPFGPRADPFTGRPALHHGVDLAAPEGTEVRAALPGVVRLSGDRGGYGLAVELDHGGGLTTLYGHASEVLVTEGEVVTQGQPIARVGQTGRATGPHLHLEVRQGRRPVDPGRALKAYGARVEELIGSGGQP